MGSAPAVTIDGATSLPDDFDILDGFAELLAGDAIGAEILKSHLIVIAFCIDCKHSEIS